MNVVQLIREGDSFTNLLTGQEDHKISLYKVMTNDRTFLLNREQVELLYRYYVRNGYNLSTQDLSIHFPSFTSIDLVGIRTSFFNTFKLRKDDSIITPHELEEHTIEEIKDIVADFIRHKQILECKKDLPSTLNKIIEEQKELIEQLQDYKTIIKEGFKDIPYTPIVIPQIPSNKSLALWISDMHIGCKVTTSGATMGENIGWNNDMVLDRLNQVLTVIGNQGHFNDIWIFNLGDAIDGMDGTTSRRDVSLPQNMNNSEMARNYRSDILYLFNSLIASNAANNYHFRTVCQSNHGGDFEAQASEFLVEQLKHLGIDAAMAETSFGLTKIQNIPIVYGHGKDNLNQQRPLGIGLDHKTKEYIDALLRAHHLTAYFGNILVVKGDQHRYNLSTCNDYTYLSVGSLFGSSEWAQSNFPCKGWEVNYSIFDNGNVIHGSVKDVQTRDVEIQFV